MDIQTDRELHQRLQTSYRKLDNPNILVRKKGREVDELILTCSCGHQKRISVYAVGMIQTCEGCGQPIQSSNENTTAPPVEQPAPVRAAPADAAPVRQTPRPPDACLRCGKAFRGDWDRVETPQGVVCHHCSVLAAESAPDLSHLTSPSELNIEKAPNLDPPPKMISIGPWTVDPESDSFKRWILALGLFFVAITVVVVFTDDYVPPDQRDASTAEAKKVPGYIGNLYAAWQLTAFFLTAFFALYLVLQRDLRLPHETFGRNALYIGRGMLVITVILAAITGSTFAIAQLFYFGGFVLVIVITIAGGLSIISAMTKYFDFGLKDYFVWFVFFSLLEILAQAVTTAFWAAIYSVVL